MFYSARKVPGEWDNQLKLDNPNNFDMEVTGVIFDCSSVV